MAFIDKKDQLVLNVMLTSNGREQLSAGNLEFKYFTIGDSEIDYSFIREINSEIDPDFNPFDSSILRPKDKNPDIISYIPRNISGDTYNEISTTSPILYNVVNTAQPLGFFTNSGATFIIESTHVKQPDIMIYMSGVTGGTSLKLKKAPTYGNSIDEPMAGDLLLVKWTNDTDTTGHTVNYNLATQNLMYQIVSKSGTLSGNTLNVVVDRILPNLDGYSPIGVAGAMVYYSSITQTMLPSTDYLTESVLNFLENYQCGIEKFPFWNMSIIYTEEIAGIQSVDRKFGQFNTRKYGGFVSYIQNQSSYYRKLGVIHYTNNSPANTYGEEFYLDTPVLHIPLIMWHKSTGSTLGVKLVASGVTQLLTGTTKSLNIEYYDLADLNTGTIVGKVFNGLKLFVIEDQELLFAMSYKSNRSWTLPDYYINIGTNPCPPQNAPTTTTTTTVAPTTTTTTTIPISSEIFFNYVDVGEDTVMGINNPIGQSMDITFEYDLSANAQFIDATTTAYYSIDDGMTWNVMASVSAITPLNGVVTKVITGSYLVSNVLNVPFLRIKITTQDEVSSGGGYVAITSVISDIYASTIICMDKYIKTSGSSATINCI